MQVFTPYNKGAKRKLFDIVSVSLLPTGIGYIAEILENNRYLIGPVFKSDVIKMHYHKIDAKDCKPINVDVIPDFMVESYNKYLNQ